MIALSQQNILGKKSQHFISTMDELKQARFTDAKVLDCTIRISIYRQHFPVGCGPCTRYREMSRENAHDERADQQIMDKVSSDKPSKKQRSAKDFFKKNAAQKGSLRHGMTRNALVSMAFKRK